MCRMSFSCIRLDAEAPQIAIHVVKEVDAHRSFKL